MIFVDLPGCGKSECAGRKNFSFDDSAVEIIKLIKQLSPEGKAILIAHSYGGLDEISSEFNENQQRNKEFIFSC